MHQEMQQMVQIDEGSGEIHLSMKMQHTYELWWLIKNASDSYTD